MRVVGLHHDLVVLDPLHELEGTRAHRLEIGLRVADLLDVPAELLEAGSLGGLGIDELRAALRTAEARGADVLIVHARKFFPLINESTAFSIANDRGARQC